MPIITDYSREETAQRVSLLHDVSKPNCDAQIEVVAAFFRDQLPLVFTQCGRKFGKSWLASYCGWRAAIIKKDFPIYYLAPIKEQAREILWAPQRLQYLGPSSFVKKIYNQEMRVVFKNGSFIKIDGTDNAEKLRGPAMGLILLDEAKDSHPDCYTALAPNLAITKGSFGLFGTPPDNDVTPQQKFFHEMVSLAKKIGFHTIYPSTANPKVDPEWINQQRYFYMHRNELDIFEREYLGVYRKGASSAIFPMFENPQGRHVKDYQNVMSVIWPDRTRLEYFCVADPGGDHPFAVLFMALDRARGIVYVLSELVFKNHTDNSVGSIMPQIVARIDEIMPERDLWRFIYDEQALWFQINAQSVDSTIPWTPTNKYEMRKNTKEELKPFLTLIKDLMHRDQLVITDTCPHTIWELKSYIKAKNGHLPKLNDDCIDCLRYGVSAMCIDLSASQPEPPRYAPRETVADLIGNDVEMNLSDLILNDIESWF